MHSTPKTRFKPFLADTWWFALTQRLDSERFEELAHLRVSQGFTAVQLVVGIPPEVGVKNANAASILGPAWDLRGKINEKYLELAKEKITLLNQIGLTVIIYGAWGHQMAWLGTEGMKHWWEHIIRWMDDLDVMYCLTGESNIWIGQEALLLPDRTSYEVFNPTPLPIPPGKLGTKLVNLGRRIKRIISKRLPQPPTPQELDLKRERIRQWSDVLKYVSGLTEKPIFIHPLPGETGYSVVETPELLAANTVQTGHDSAVRPSLWQLPYQLTTGDSHAIYVNLEPWYEGILDQFGKNDQLYAYWVSMLAGAYAHCYGAHGIWNVGDGKFLAQWGRQTFDEAASLETPQLLGESHKLLMEMNVPDWDQVDINEVAGRLLTVRKSDGKHSITFYPDVEAVSQIVEGRYYLPSTGRFSEVKPEAGSLVVVVS